MNKFRFKVSTMLEQVEDDYIKFVGDNYGVNQIGRASCRERV